MQWCLLPTLFIFCCTFAYYRNTNSRVAVAKFGGLTELRELKLRGVCGIQLPAFSIGGGLSELGQLKQLTKLVRFVLCCFLTESYRCGYFVYNEIWVMRY